MVTKRGRKSTKNVKNLPAKSLASSQEKKVSGGANGGVWKTRDLASALLPYMEKRNS